MRLSRPASLPAAIRRYTFAVPYILAITSLLLFARRARFGLHAIGFNDEVMHLLGGWALLSGDRLYRDFIDLHGPFIFLLSQTYGALFGFGNPIMARLIMVGFAILAGMAVAASPALRPAPRALGVFIYMGLLACVWLVQGLYWFNYYTVSGALAVITLALFTLPATAHARIPRFAAAASGAASVCLAFTSYSEAPSALLFSFGGCIAAWAGGQKSAVRAHVLGFCATGLLLLAWLLTWGDVVGYLTFHFLFGQMAYQKNGAVTFGQLISSLTPSLKPDHLVQLVAIIAGALGSAASAWLALRPGAGRAAAAFSVLTTLAGLILLDVRGLTIFQNGAMLMAAIGLFAVTIPAGLQVFSLPGGSPPLWASAASLLTVAIVDAGMRHAIYSPTPLTRAQFLAQPPAAIALQSDDPLDQAIRRFTTPNERILALVYRPDIYWSSGRLPVHRLYEYLPQDARYAKSPVLGEQRDICTILAKSPPPVIVFDNWTVWGVSKPIDYMPCLFAVLVAKYTYVPEPGDAGREDAKLYARSDRLSASEDKARELSKP